MQRTFRAYEDCGHAWVKVPKKLLTELNIADKITTYSYQRGEYAYLEEDYDLTIFATAYKVRTGNDIKFNCSYSDHSRIRNYEHYDGAIMGYLVEV